MSTLTARSAPRTILGLLAALGLVAALTMPALASHDPGDGPEVDPTTESFPGHGVVCETGVGYRFENPATGDEADIDLGEGIAATVTIAVTGNLLTFEVENGLASTVRVKGGKATVDDVNVYDYSAMTGGGIAHDDGLTTPNEQGISHIDFCIVNVPEAEESQPEESQPEESQPEESQPEESQPEESQPEESQPEESQPEESEVAEESEAAGESAPAESIREGELGGNPTPGGGTLPDTAVGQFGQIPATVLSLVLMGALAATVYVRLARQR